MKKFSKLNLYTVVDITTIITVIVIILYLSTKKIDPKWVFAVMAPSGIVGLFQIFFGHTKVENNSDNAIQVKPEAGNEPKTVSAHSELYGVDGVKCNGKVYKAVDGTHIVV